MGKAAGICVVVTGQEAAGPDGLRLLLGLARHLAGCAGDRTTLLDLGVSPPPATPEDLSIDRIVRVSGVESSPVDPRPAARALADILAEREFSVVLLTHTHANLALASRVAARLGAGLVSGAIGLERRPDGSLLATRPVDDGRQSCVMEFARPPQLATVETEALMPGPPPEPRPAAVEEAVWKGAAPAAALEVLDLFEMDPDASPLTEARVVVGAGLGAGLPDSLPLMQALAGALRAPLAGSRPVVDRGWLPAARLVGQSGKIISPEVYIACGLSGSPQHLVGMRGAQAIIALNKDPGAPIMRLADLAVVGDCHPVLKELLAVLGKGRPAPGGPAA